jgi:hypothetical protein
MGLNRIIGAAVFVFVLFSGGLSATQDSGSPNSVLCQFETMATAELRPSGKVLAGGGNSQGEIVISNLNSYAPLESVNVGAVNLKILKRSKEAIWLAEFTQNEEAGVISLFFESGIVMHTKHEILHTVTGEAPFGFVEIGRFRALK